MLRKMEEGKVEIKLNRMKYDRFFCNKQNKNTNVIDTNRERIKLQENVISNIIFRLR